MNDPATRDAVTSILKLAISMLVLETLLHNDLCINIVSIGIRMNVRKRDSRPRDMNRFTCDVKTDVSLQSG